MICGFNAVIKLFTKLPTTWFTWFAIPYAALTTTPKKRFITMEMPWPWPMDANAPTIVHIEKAIICIITVLSTFNFTALHSSKCRLQYQPYNNLIIMLTKNIRAEYVISLSTGEYTRSKTSISFSETSMMDIYAKADIFSFAMMAAL